LKTLGGENSTSIPAADGEEKGEQASSTAKLGERCRTGKKFRAGKKGEGEDVDLRLGAVADRMSSNHKSAITLRGGRGS